MYVYILCCRADASAVEGENYFLARDKIPSCVKSDRDLVCISQ